MDKYKDTLYVLYGSRTGNAKAVAVLAHEYAKSLGYATVLGDMQDFDYGELQYIENLLITVSTHGEGEPPVQAERFYEQVHSTAVSSVKAKYAVLGLGDSSYRYFCQTGEDLDKRLATLGGQSVMGLVKCDIDFEETAKEWVRDAFVAFKGILPVVNKVDSAGFTFELKSGNNPNSAYRAELLEKKMLTTADSSKKVLHVSLSLKNSGIEYIPGDAIGVYGTNSRAFVDELLQALKFDKAYPVKVNEETHLLKNRLIHEYELTLITPLVIRKYAALVQHKALDRLLDNEAQLEAYAAEGDVLDLVLDFPGQISVEDFLSVLRKLNQRLYSVASSRAAVGDRADITVKVIENNHGERSRNGVCSSFLWNRLDVGDKVPITLETIAKLRLPEDDNVPVVMISAGTGIAPFRAFLQERSARQAKGNAWLIFGERNSKSDFLYQEELLAYKSSGVLSELSTVFSRDQDQKRYVSHVIEENGAALIEQLEKGAVIYVCGSKDTLAVTVRQSLLRIFAKYLKKDAEQALAYFEALKANKQYQEEVY